MSRTKDAPKVEEAIYRFPLPLVQINELITFNRGYKAKLQIRLPMEKDREELILKVIKETDECYRNWDYIRDVKGSYTVYNKRVAFLNFKNAMLNYQYKDEPNFWESGEMPPYVPYWRFQERE